MTTKSNDYILVSQEKAGNEAQLPVASAVEEDDGAIELAEVVVQVADPLQQQPYATIPLDSATPAYFKVKATVNQPENMASSMVNDRLEIQRKWKTPEVYSLICFATFWNGFLIFWNMVALLNGIWLMAVLIILHDLVGLHLIYTIVVVLFNSTYMIVQSGCITVVHRPFTWLHPAKEFSTKDVVEVRCKRNIWTGEKGNVHTSYAVLFADRNGVDHVVVEGLPKLEEALYFEQELEKYLGIGHARNILPGID